MHGFIDGMYMDPPMRATASGRDLGAMLQHARLPPDDRSRGHKERVINRTIKYSITQNLTF